MSELRLYCDLLVQQVQTIQTQYTADTEAPPTVEVARLLFSPNQVTAASFNICAHLLCRRPCSVPPVQLSSGLWRSA